MILMMLKTQLKEEQFILILNFLVLNSFDVHLRKIKLVKVVPFIIFLIPLMSLKQKQIQMIIPEQFLIIIIIKSDNSYYKGTLLKTHLEILICEIII